MKDHSRTHLTPADLLAVFAGYGITPETAIREETAIRDGGRVADDDGPTERVIRQSDIDERREREYERWLDRDGRWFE